MLVSDFLYLISLFTVINHWTRTG